MKAKILLKEKTTHGTALVPIAIHHLSHGPHIENFFYLHWHDEFEFVYVLEGAIIYTIEDTDYRVMAGEGLFVHSNQLHAARSYNGMPCEACVVLFHPNLFNSDKQGSAYSRFIYPILNGEISFNNFFKCDEAWQKSVLRLIEEMDALKNENPSDNELLLKSRIFEIWHLCYTNSVAAAPENRKNKSYKLERLQPVLDYINKNYKEEISLTILANILPMSKGQFCHTFKEAMNMAPIAYVIRCRILHSCTLLTQTDWKIADIAKTVGFNNISYFNREFAKAVGCSPGKYRLEK
jgi:AraC-like DNA-binding protein/mannose-6-phosphate isomerase-like protein (cupin superfamily)